MIGSVLDYNKPSPILNVDFQTRDNTIIESDTGDLYIKGLASTNDRDTNNDIVTESALQSMLNWISKAKVNLHIDHKHKVKKIIGKIVQAEIIGNQLWITAKILPEYKNYIEHLLDFGISLGLSVGGKAIRSPVNPNIITDYLLMEISITPIPALMESKGTVEEVETPTCITGACYLALKEDEKNNNINKFKHDNKTYNENNELINMNSYNQDTCVNTQELENIEQYLVDIARKVDYNNKYGFDNKSYNSEMDSFMQDLQSDQRYDIIGMCASFTPDELKDAGDAINTMTNYEYQNFVADAGIQGMVPQNMDVKFWATALNIAKLIPLIYNGITGGIDIYNTFKNIFGKKKQAPPTPAPDYAPTQVPYPPTTLFPPMQKVKKSPNYYNRLFGTPKGRYDYKSFNYVGEPMSAYGMEQQEALPDELMGAIEQIFMRMFNEAMHQKEKIMEDNVTNNIISQMQGLGGGNMVNPTGMMGQPPLQGPTVPPMEEPAEPPIEESEAFGEAPLTPEEEAAAAEEEFEEQAVRKKFKKGKKKNKKEEDEELDTKNYNYPEPPYYETPFLDTSRADVPDSKVSKMQDIIDRQAQGQKEAAGTGFTRHRNEFGEFIE